MKLVKGMILGALMALPLSGIADEVTNVTWKSSVSLGATYKAGNSDKSLFTGNLKANRSAPKSEWNNNLYGEYGETGTATKEKEQTEGHVRGQSDYRYKFGGKNFFGGVFGEAYQDSIKQIRIRLKLGPNIGYYFINKETHKFDVSGGINYVYERTAFDERDYGEWRLASNYLIALSEKAEYYLNVEYSANLEDANDGNGLLVTGVKSQVKDNLSMFVELRDEYDNIPDTPTAEYNDVTILAGLTYDF
jgi:putative salt-induced outer membrane protein YdiY